MTAAGLFVREHLRAPVTLALLAALPFAFVLLASSVLGEFAGALGGELAGNAAAALGAGWSAAFIAGALGFFEIQSSRAADRRFALAGRGVVRVALARVAAALTVAALAAAAGFAALALETGAVHPWHALAAIFGYALIYIGVGALVGSVIDDALAGSLAVAFVFLLDVFSGPGMTEGDGSPLSISRSAGDVLIAAALGGASPGREWVELALWAGGAIGLAVAAFALSARSRA